MFRTVTHASRILSLCFVLWALVSVVSSTPPESLVTCPRCHKNTLAPALMGDAPNESRCNEPVLCKEGHEVAQGCGATKSAYVKQCFNKVRKGTFARKEPCGFVSGMFFTCGAPGLHRKSTCRCPPGSFSGSQSGQSSSSSGWSSRTSWS
ncbi:hypothetical protein PGT21_008332 [Puccinia graminis f. sp. tritici]|uniref:Secreted protein n=1 Tax=Puccinia graminis f. sp. tritici TaxID=56615 RepID=A0A5B0N216_PUCGR|nr:hypothetical protein PGT21_008332 [Puccinia graminis f. sp. tritici]KAA1133493.1 hypothetical protein PGTUg99_018637 [Puccinia graminis f. sp. tritici]